MRLRHNRIELAVNDERRQVNVFQRRRTDIAGAFIAISEKTKAL